MATDESPGSDETRSFPNLPGFTIREVLGRGGMGVVYRAEQHSPRRMVALKLLSVGATTPDQLARFRREAAVIAGLEHPRIVPLYGFGEHQGQPYLVLRLLRGGSAADRLSRGPVDLATAIAWIEETAAALDFAHQRGLVHRDVKPSNMLLDEAGHAYLTDFGIAAALDDSQAGQTIGSAAYMSPEQGRGEQVDHRADIYALAVSLFELLTGEKPYKAETPLGVIVRHIHDAIPSARAINPSVPPAVDAAVKHGMAKTVGDRPSSAGALAREVRVALADTSRAQGAATVLEPGGQPQAAAELAAPAIPVVRPTARRGPAVGVWGAIVVIGACVVGALILGGGVGLAALLGNGDVGTPIAAVATATASGIPTAPLWLLADDFSDPESGFPTGSDADGGVEYVEGRLRITVLTDGIEWRSPSRRVNAEDVTVSVVVAAHSGPARSDLGVLCRWQDSDNFVALAINNDSQAAIWRKAAGEIEFLSDWHSAAGIGLGQGGQLDLTVTCAGEHLRLEAGGQLLAEADDPVPAAGDIALLARLREAGQLVVDFDDLIVAPAE